MVAQRHQCYNHHCLVTVEFLIQSLSHHLLSWIEKTTEWLPGDSGLNSSCMDSLRCLILQILEVICSATSTFMLTANSCSSQQSPPPTPKTQKSQQNCNMVWLKVYPMQQDIKATLSTKKRKKFVGKFLPCEKRVWLLKLCLSLIFPTKVQHLCTVSNKINYLWGLYSSIP